MKNFLLAVLIATTFSVVSVSAQDPVSWYINNTILSTRVFNSIMANKMLEKKGNNSSNLQRKNQNTQPKTKVDYTVFKFSPNNSISGTLAQKAGKNAQSQQQAKQMFDSLLDLYKKTAKEDGYPADDLAYAFSYLVINNYVVYHDLVNVPYEKDPRIKGLQNSYERMAAINKKQSEKIRPEQERAVYNQFKQYLSSNPNLQNLTDADKQEVAEFFAIMTGFNFGNYMRAVNDENDQSLQSAKKAAQNSLEKFLGAPIGEIKITYKGLEL